MGLMRVLSMKRASGVPTRSFSTLKGRPQISLPTELISSTNNISYTAPSIKTMQQAAADAVAALGINTESRTTSHDEERTPQTPTITSSVSGSRRCSDLSAGSAPSLTDNSTVSSSPSSPDPQYSLPSRSSYFAEDTLTKPSSNTSLQILVEDSVDPFTISAPVLPRRAPSHSKREHERLARRRSQRTSQRLDGSTTLLLPSLSGGEVAADEVISPVLPVVMPELPEVDEESPAIERLVPQVQVQEPEAEDASDGTAQHPFSQELEQLAEAVDELSALVEDEDMRVMRERGLQRWSVSGYLDVVGDAWDCSFAPFSDALVVA